MESRLDIVQQEEATCPSGCEGCAIARYIDTVGNGDTDKKTRRQARHTLVDQISLHNGMVADLQVNNRMREASLHEYAHRIRMCVRITDDLYPAVTGAYQGASIRTEEDMRINGSY